MIQYFYETVSSKEKSAKCIIYCLAVDVNYNIIILASILLEQTGVWKIVINYIIIATHNICYGVDHSSLHVFTVSRQVSLFG